MATKAKEERKEILIAGNCIIPFKAGSKRCGHAEFQFCIVWKRGRIKDIFIYTRQQEKPYSSYYYVVKDVGSTGFTFSGYGCEDPRVWQVVWCKEHKAISLSVYVPNDAVGLWLHPLSTYGFGFIPELKPELGEIIKPWGPEGGAK